MVDEAHGEVKLALQELRDLARGIHPAVLTDRGLDAALSAVASRCTVPVTGDGRPADAARRRHRGHRLLHRLRAAPERQQAQRRALGVGRRLARPDGPAADPGADDGPGRRATHGRRGTRAWRGLAERLGAVDGLLVVDSPAGGPTTVTAELPWRG